MDRTATERRRNAAASALAHRRRDSRLPAAWSGPTTCGRRAPAPPAFKEAAGLEGRATRRTTRRAARGGKRSTMPTSMRSSAQVDVTNQTIWPRPRGCAKLAAAMQRRARWPVRRPSAAAPAQLRSARATGTVRPSSTVARASPTATTSRSARAGRSICGAACVAVSRRAPRPAQASDADLAAAQLSLQSAARAGLSAAACQDAQIDLLRETVASYERSLQLTPQPVRGRHRRRAATSRRPRRSSSRRRRRCSTRESSRAQLEHAIAVLVGKPPAELTIAPREPRRRVPRRSRSPCPRSCSSGDPTSLPPSGAVADRQRADRRRPGGVLSVALAAGHRRIPKLGDRQPVRRCRVASGRWDRHSRRRSSMRVCAAAAERRKRSPRATSTVASFTGRPC